MTPIFNVTMTHKEFCFDQKSNLSSFGRKILRLIWCEYRPLLVEVIFKDGVNTTYKYMDIYECVPGIIPNLLKKKKE